jgi:hypothetical protein
LAAKMLFDRSRAFTENVFYDKNMHVMFFLDK